MARIFVQTVHGMPWGAGAAATFSGFRDMGAEIVPLSADEGIPGGTPEDMTVDRVECVRRRLHELGCTVPSASYIQNPFRAISDAGSGVPPSMPHPAILNLGRSL